MNPAAQLDEHPLEPKSAKVRKFDLDRAGAYAEQFNSNRMEMFSCFRRAWEALSRKRQSELVGIIRREMPFNAPRRGRGNRKLSA